MSRSHASAVLATAAIAAMTAPPPHLTAQPGGRPYPAAAHGGNYMHNFHFPPAPSSSPWYPAWHPGGERVAVAMSGSLWEVDIATGDAHEIVHGPDYYSSPNYSPDGAWLLYTADDAGRTIHLEVMNTATGERHRLTEGAHIHTDPRFSPSGDRIAYVSTAPSGYFNVYIRPFAGAPGRARRPRSPRTTRSAGAASTSAPGTCTSRLPGCRTAKSS